MAISQCESDYLVPGTLTVGTSVNLPAGSLQNTDIEASAGIDASKLDHYETVAAFLAGQAASQTIQAFYAPAAGTLRSTFHAGSVTPCSGAAEVEVDLQVDGVSVLASVITLDSTNSARVAEQGTVQTASVSAGSLVEVVLTASPEGSSNLASDVFASFGIDYTYPT
jgi:hypothetical protein